MTTCVSVPGVMLPFLALQQAVFDQVVITKTAPPSLADRISTWAAPSSFAPDVLRPKLLEFIGVR